MMGNFKKAREQAGLSQKEISIILRVSNATISHWESGKRIPTGKHLLQLSNILNCSADYLLGKSNDATPLRLIKQSSERTSSQILEEYMNSTNFSDESRERLLDYVNLLEIKEMQIRNTEVKNEIAESG